MPNAAAAAEDVVFEGWTMFSVRDGVNPDDVFAQIRDAGFDVLSMSLCKNPGDCSVRLRTYYDARRLDTWLRQESRSHHILTVFRAFTRRAAAL